MHEKDQDAQRILWYDILWYDNLEERDVTDYRFTHVIFGATSTKILAEPNFPLHKWRSNVESLEKVKCCKDENDQTYAESLVGNK